MGSRLRSSSALVTDPWIRLGRGICHICTAAFVPRRPTCVLVHCSPPRSWRWSSRWPPAGVTTARPRPTEPARRHPTSAAAEAEEPSARDATDLLAEICDKGVLTVSTDPAYPPQSSLNEQTGEYEGFDIDVATEIANRLGVDVAWEAPAWDVITAGSWNGRWDTTVGSMTPTNDRQKVLDFTEPYNYTPAVVVVPGRRRVGHRPDHRPRRQEDRRLQRLHLRAVPQQDAGHRRLHVRLRHRRRRSLRLRHRHDGAAGPRQRPPGRGDHLGDDRAGLHRRRQPGEDRRGPGVLRAALGRLRQELRPVVAVAVRGGGRHRRATCTRTAR